MRTHVTLLAFACTACALFMASGYSEEDASSSPKIRAQLVDPFSPEAAYIRRSGEAAINWLGAKLVYEVRSTVAKAGTDKAVAICHLKTVEGKETPLAHMPQILAVKRTSLKVNNPANAPDAAEKLILEEVDRNIRQGRRPEELLVQRIDLPSGESEWRVYRPLATLPSCIACHGDADAQPPEVRKALDDLFPGHEATGYRVGEWRGLLRVTVKPESAQGSEVAGSGKSTGS